MRVVASFLYPRAVALARLIPPFIATSVSNPRANLPSGVDNCSNNFEVSPLTFVVNLLIPDSILVSLVPTDLLRVSSVFEYDMDPSAALSRELVSFSNFSIKKSVASFRYLRVVAPARLANPLALNSASNTVVLPMTSSYLSLAPANNLSLASVIVFLASLRDGNGI